MNLQEFLLFPFTKDIKLLNHVDHLEDIPVKYIRTLENTGISFIRVNEIIISSAISIIDDREKLRCFINGVYKKKAAGLILSSEVLDFDVLNPILREYELLNFPIFFMNYEISFSEIVEKTLRELWAEEDVSLCDMESMKRDLLNNYLDGKNLNFAADILSKYFKSDILIVDITHQIYGKNKALDRMNEKNLLQLFEKDSYCIDISSNNRRYGHIFIKDSTYINNYVSPFTKQCINTPLSLWFDRELAIAEPFLKAKENYLYQLVHQKYSSTQDIISKAEILGINTAIKYVCFVVEISDTTTVHNTESFTQCYSTILQEQIQRTCREKHRLALTLIDNNLLFVFLECPDSVLSIDMANQYIDIMENDLKIAFQRLQYTWGYDNQAYPLSAFYIGYERAITALELCKSLSLHPARYCLNLSLKQKLLSLIALNEEFISESYVILKKLMKQEKGAENVYIDTIRAYIATNYNISRTAERLHIHRQSLLYRMERIENILGFSLKEHDNLFILELCIMIHDNFKL